MRTTHFNIILIVLIIMVLGVFGFFGWKAFNSKEQTHNEVIQKFVPDEVINRGKPSEDRDAVLEADVRKINEAIQLYAKNHKGIYPESNIQNPCTGTSYCLKSVDLSQTERIFLNPIPQIQPNNIDYYYRADNKTKTYCIKTPVVLETVNTMLYECTQIECKRVLLSESCVK